MAAHDYQKFNPEEEVPIHEIRSMCSFGVGAGVYGRMMRVESGWLYSFWNAKEQTYRPDWIFVPTNNKPIK